MPESWGNNKGKVNLHDTNLVEESTFQVKAFWLLLTNENGKENNLFTQGSFDFSPWEISCTLLPRMGNMKKISKLLFAFFIN